MKYVTAFAALMFATSVAAAGGQLANPGTTPDSALYGLDRAMESVSLALSFSEESKAEKKLGFAEERLAEAEAMVNKNKSDKAYKATEEYTEQLREVENVRAQAKEASRIQKKFSNTTYRHMNVLHQKEVIPGNPLYTAKKEAEGFAVSSETDPVRKVERQAKVATHRVEEAEALSNLNRSRDASRVTEEFIEERNRLEGVVNSLNRTQEREEAGRLLENVTRHHQQVLERVKARAPEEAMEGLNKALNASKKGFENLSGGEGAGEAEGVPAEDPGAGNRTAQGETGNAPPDAGLN